MNTCSSGDQLAHEGDSEREVVSAVLADDAARDGQNVGCLETPFERRSKKWRR